MIRSAKLSTKFVNINKKEQYNVFLEEYRNITKDFTNILWEMDKIPSLLPKEITSLISSWLSARMIQCAGKQASGIVRGARQKQEQRIYIMKKLMKEGKNPKKLQRAIAKAKISKPDITHIQPELDSRFVEIDIDNETSFDVWVTLSSIGNRMKITVPLKKTRVFNKWNQKGTLKKGVRLSVNNITFMFDVPEDKKTEGKTIGIDIGEKNVFTASDRQFSQPDKHGWTLDKITQKLARKKKGSNGFQRTQNHRKNHINWSLNQLNLDGIKQVNIENIKGLRYKSRTNRRLSHWTYTEIFDKIGRYCEEFDVRVNTINPTYTSQRCSVCSWTQRKNRDGKQFHCKKCNFTADADWNASLNLSFDLPEISWEDRQKHLNIEGFYWNVFGQETIVPVVQKT